MYLPRMDFVTRGYQGSKMSVQGAGRNSARKPRIPGESGVKCSWDGVGMGLHRFWKSLQGSGQPGAAPGPGGPLRGSWPSLGRRMSTY